MNKNFIRRNLKYIPILIFIGIVIFTFINTYFKSKTVHFENYNFVITKVENTPTGSAIPYEGDIERQMWQYSFFPKKIIKVGDSLHKGSEEKYLFIFRKDETENFILIDSIQPTGMYYWDYKTR